MFKYKYFHAHSIQKRQYSQATTKQTVTAEKNILVVNQRKSKQIPKSELVLNTKIAVQESFNYIFCNFEKELINKI